MNLKISLLSPKIHETVTQADTTLKIAFYNYITPERQCQVRFSTFLYISEKNTFVWRKNTFVVLKIFYFDELG